MSVFSIDFSKIAEFDALAQSISAKLRCDASLICVSHEDKLVTLGLGRNAANLNRRTYNPEDMICGLVVRSGRVLSIGDVRSDAELNSLPAVRDLNVAAYLGVPLSVEGRGVMGAVCVLSETVRDWRADEAEYLRAVSGLVESRIDRQLLRYEQKELSAALAENDAVLTVLSKRRGEALTVHNANGALVYANSAMRTELKLCNQAMLALPCVAHTLIQAEPRAGFVAVELPFAADIPLMARVSDAENGLTLMEWSRDPLR